LEESLTSYDQCFEQAIRLLYVVQVKLGPADKEINRLKRKNNDFQSSYNDMGKEMEYLMTLDRDNMYTPLHQLLMSAKISDEQNIAESDFVLEMGSLFVTSWPAVLQIQNRSSHTLLALHKLISLDCLLFSVP